MNSELSADTAATAVTLDGVAHRAAAIAARQLDVPIERWIALAILGTAADQAGIGGPIASGADTGGVGTEPAEISSTDPVLDVLSRLEAKLDRALTLGPNRGQTTPYGGGD